MERLADDAHIRALIRKGQLPRPGERMKLNLLDPPKIDRSPIEWCGPTWNPWRGCRKISPGCANCYMFREQRRYGKDPAQVVRTSEAIWRRPLKWQREVEAGIRRGRDRLVFTCSWSDWFIEHADPWRERAWSIVRDCPGLIFQILTKRAEAVESRLPSYWDEIRSRVWLGFSAESQKYFDSRWQIMRQFASSGIVFCSAEPLLGRIDPSAAMPPTPPASSAPRLGWMIAGGESGPDSRTSDPNDFRLLRDRCKAGSVPFFFKQWGGRNKKQAGRLLDGVLHDRMPPID